MWQTKLPKKKSKFVEFIQEKGIIYATEIFLYFSHLCKILPKKKTGK
jgi:hypothetical protein